MAIDHQKLLNVATKADGSLTARCPACAASGADTKGEHLIVFPDGRFGCVANPSNRDHNKAILLLAGEAGGDKGKRTVPKLEIRPQKIEASKRILVLGQIGQENPTPESKPSRQPETAPLQKEPSVTETPSGEEESPIIAEAAQATISSAELQEAKAFLRRKRIESPIPQ